MYNLYNLRDMPWVSISVTEDEKQFLKNSLLSPTKIFKWALQQKGFKPGKK